MSSNVALTSMGKKPAYQEFIDECVVPVQRSPSDRAMPKVTAIRRAEECAGEALSKVVVQSTTDTRQGSVAVVKGSESGMAGKITSTVRRPPERRKQESDISNFFSGLFANFPCNLKHRIAEQELLIERQRGLIQQQLKLLRDYKYESRNLRKSLDSQTSSSEALVECVTALNVIINEKDQRISELEETRSIPTLHEFLNGTDGSLPTSPRSSVSLSASVANSSASRSVSPEPTVQGMTSDFELVEDYGVLTHVAGRESPMLVEEMKVSEEKKSASVARDSGSDEEFTIVEDSGEIRSW